MIYDAARRAVATTDPAGRTVTQAWCSCGSLDALIDANGNRTRWERDVQGRVTREVRADEVTDTLYAYDLAGRLKTVTDPKDQVTTHTYLTDNALSGTVWANAPIATPSVSYTYDPIYPRVATMADGIGTTSYTYKAPATFGAGQVATVDGPLTNDTISYTYDELGRATARAINGAANTVAWTFDTLGRVTNEANGLGTFTYGYDGVTNRIASVTYSNNQTSNGLESIDWLFRRAKSRAASLACSPPQPLRAAGHRSRPSSRSNDSFAEGRRDPSPFALEIVCAVLAASRGFARCAAAR
jgi:YD repeat-containing protein